MLPALAGPLAPQFPYMVDPNTGTAMYESDAIIDYLFKTYGEGLPPLGLRLGALTAISCGLAMLPRWAAAAEGKSRKAACAAASCCCS